MIFIFCVHLFKDHMHCFCHWCYLTTLAILEVFKKHYFQQMLSELQNNNNNGTNKAGYILFILFRLLKVLFEWHKFICATMYFL